LNMRSLKIYFVAVAGISLCLTGSSANAEDCASLAKLRLPSTQITVAQVVAAGDFDPPAAKRVSVTRPFCRVAVVSTPASDSRIEFEVWLPTTGWNGKFQGIGNGGFAGSISFYDLARAVDHGYAAASTNTGHYADGTDASWALNHPDKIVDFGYRAIHLTNVNGKAIIKAFYGSAPKRAFFSSCSNGGRQALMEAQRYPDDYDGIIAGAPANYWTHLLSNAAWDNQALLKDTTTYIPAAKLPAIENAALAACDAQDGVKDEVIEDPPHCRFDTSVLLCHGADTNTCITEPQLKVLNGLYAGGRTRAGEQVFPGYSPGGEADPAGWQPWITGPAPEKSLMYAFSTQFFKNMVYMDPAWDFHTFDMDRDTKAADEKMARDLNANDPDLSRFRTRGGKLILYHGWNDAAIAPTATITYYQRVVKKLGPAQTDGFVRLFMVPGLEHCTGGTGPDRFGQDTVASGDPEHSIASALEQWVEGGAAPNRIVAAKRELNGKVNRTRPICAYPAIAHYKGSGSTDTAENFTCSTR
jgi:feruloyl esterase